jgi:hypothetical protein
MGLLTFRKVGTSINRVPRILCREECRELVNESGAKKQKTPQAKSFAGFSFYCADCLANYFLVPKRGLEPPHLAAHGPEPCASTNSATWANRYN